MEDSAYGNRKTITNNMKRKTAKKPVNEKIDKRSLLINSLTIALFGSVFVWMIVGIYNDATHEAGTDDTYLSSLPGLRDTIMRKKVCMVDDIYLGKGSFAVSISNKTYYGCSQKATMDIIVDSSIRIAEDPVSKRKADKATAIIALHPDKNGEVIYFESKETYKIYINILKRSDAEQN